MRYLLFIIALFISPLILSSKGIEGESWSDILKTKEGNITCLWYTNDFDVSKSGDVLDQIEHELIDRFILFLEKEYGIALTVEWVITEDFGSVITKTSESSGGVFGLSSISITEERRKIVSFTPQFIPDIAVVVSNGNVPLVETPSEFRNTFDTLTAFSIRNTTLEHALFTLQEKASLAFDIKYVSNSEELISTLANTKKGFGYMDLPNFLETLRNSHNLRRQLFYPNKLEGLAAVYPKESDWADPIKAYFTSPVFFRDREELMGKYLGTDVYDIIQIISNSAEIGPYEEIVILREEIELQYQEILEANEIARRNEQVRNYSIGGVLLLIFVSTLGYIRFVVISRTNKNLEEQQVTIAQKNEHLIELNEEKNNLINVLAHDLRSPISQVIALSELVKRTEKLSSSGTELLNYMETASRSASSLIEKILDVKAIEAGSKNLKMERLDLTQLVDRVANNYQSSAEMKEIDIIKKYDEKARAVKTDAVYLSQIVGNLLSNAIKFSDRNRPVLIDIHDDGGFYSIQVKDEGPGFTEEDKKRLFRRYQKLSAQSTNGELSTGLGLSIVKSYAELIGSKISYESRLGEGTAFFVSIPKR